MRPFSIRGLSERHNSYNAIPDSPTAGDEALYETTTVNHEDVFRRHEIQERQPLILRFLTSHAPLPIGQQQHQAPRQHQQPSHTNPRKHGSSRSIFLTLVVVSVTAIVMLLTFRSTIHNPSSSTSSVLSGTNFSAAQNSPTSGADGTNISNITVPMIHKETVPTMLSIIDPDTGLYVYALDNPIYQALSLILEDTTTPSRKFSFREVQEWPNISILSIPRKRDPDSDLYYTDDWSWHITWTSGISSVTNNHSLIQEDDWMLLYCKSLSTENRPKTFQVGDDLRTIKGQILEAASIAQIRATHHKAMTSNCSSCPRPSLLNTKNAARIIDEWWIPIVPETILRQQNESKSTECRFGIFHKQNQTEKVISYHLVAESENVLANLSNSSLLIWNVHWSLTDRPDEMVVEFVTSASTSPWHNGDKCSTYIPVVEYSTSKATWEEQANVPGSVLVEGTSTTYTAEDLCQGPANRTFPGQFVAPGCLHAIRLVDLKPDTLYQYQLGVKQSNEQQSRKGSIRWNDRTYQFRSPVLPGEKMTSSTMTGRQEKVEFLVYADQGCPKFGWEVARQWILEMVTRNPEVRVIHHIGDLSYAQGAAHIWDEWFRILEPMLLHRGIPLMVAVGNHEYDHESGGTLKDPSGVSSDSGFMPAWGNFANDSGGECGVPVAKRFTMPNRDPNINGVFWYSFDFGLVHTIVLSSEHDLSFGSPQHTWLEHDLRGVNRILTPWILVELHRPLYEGQFNDNNVNNTAQVGVAMRNEFEDLLYDYQVDVVLAGHYHAYHRSCDFLYRGVCSDDGRGPIHLTVGTAGAHLDDTDPSEFTNSWSAKVILQTYGYGKITIANETALLFEFIQFSDESTANMTESFAISSLRDAEKNVLDRVWIVRERI